MGWGIGQPADNYTFFHGNGNANRLGTGLFSFVHKGIMSAVKRVEFIGNKMFHITLRGHKCDILF
jgi:hypothetical protein